MSEDRDLAEFLSIAQRFCAVIETAEDRNRQDVLFELGSVLPALYAASLRLPDRWSENETPEDERLGRDPYGPSYRRCMDVLGDHDGDNFWRFVNRMDGWDEPAESKLPWRRRGEDLPPHDVSSLADNLAELHLVLTDGFHVIGKGAEDEAIWEWRTHWFLWGEYVLRSLRTVHACLVAEAARNLVRGGPNFPLPPET
jgi:hypothetical protein